MTDILIDSAYEFNINQKSDNFDNQLIHIVAIRENDNWNILAINGNFAVSSIPEYSNIGKKYFEENQIISCKLFSWIQI